MRQIKQIILIIAIFVCLSSLAAARVIPQRDIPTPDTVSPQLQTLINAGLTPWWDTHPKNAAEWEELVKQRAADAQKAVDQLKKELKITITPEKIGDVPVFTIMPETLPEKNRNRILLHLHGGGYVLNPGEAGTGEALYLAAIGGFKVISVDYRMPPKFPYPAAIDDAMSVYKALLKQYPAQNIGVFGTSTGGGMTLILALRAKADGLPMPGALAAGTPWADLTLTGDSYHTNEYIDNVLVSYHGWLKDAAEIYANGHDLKDPFLSPIYGDVKGFPPVILGTGTRDLFLSNTARMHKKLRDAGVIADLLMLEGLSHAQYQMMPPNTDEVLYYFGEVARFFEKYLK